MAFAMPGAALAQGWQLQSDDDGSFFLGAISLNAAPGMALICGERSPQGLSPGQTGNLEPEITAPETFRLYLGPAQIGPPDSALTARRDVLVVVGTTGYRLPPIGWNELFSTWEVDLAATDPVFGVIAAVDAFELRSAAGSQMVSSNGFGRAFGQLTAYCQSMFAGIGLRWGEATPTPAAPPAMRQAAERAILQGCAGPATKEPDALLIAQIDGDGAEDVVVDWSRITCSGPYPRPFCGASMCSAQVFLSAKFPRTQQPDDLLAAGVRLQPLSNGNMGVSVGGSLSMCSQRGQTVCTFLFYWNGADLVPLD
jgi:hypothetical protein